MEVVPDLLLTFDQPHFLSIMRNRTGQQPGVRQFVWNGGFDGQKGFRR
jgi:hypothetical protein